jgi:P pilus assembly chaperone PapD
VPGSGTGVSPSASVLDFSGANMRIVTFTNATSAKVTFIRASLTSGKYGQSNNCGEVAPGASCTATVTYYAGSGGADEASYTLTSTAPNSPHVVKLTRSGTTGGTVPSQATSGPVALSSGGLTFSEGARTQTVTFTNTTASRITFIQASLSSAKFGQANTCGEVAPGASCTATVTYYPQNSGSTTGTFTVTSTAPNSPHVVTLAAAGGSGVRPAAAAFNHPMARPSNPLANLLAGRSPWGAP